MCCALTRKSEFGETKAVGAKFFDRTFISNLTGFEPFQISQDSNGSNVNDSNRPSLAATFCFRERRAQVEERGKMTFFLAPGLNMSRSRFDDVDYVGSQLSVVLLQVSQTNSSTCVTVTRKYGPSFQDMHLAFGESKNNNETILSTEQKFLDFNYIK